MLNSAITTTELIKLLKRVEFGASGRSREITIKTPSGLIYSPKFTLLGTGDGVAGAEVLLEISEERN